MPQITLVNETGITGTIESQAFLTNASRTVKAVTTLSSSAGPSNIFDMVVQILESADGGSWLTRASTYTFRDIGDTSAVVLTAADAIEFVEGRRYKVRTSVGQATVNISVTANF